MPAPDHAQLVAAMPFAELLGATVVEATPERVVMTLTHRPELCTAGGLLHGGVLMSLADSAGALCAFLGLPDGATTATTSSHTVLLRAVRGGTVTATAEVAHRGRRDVVVDTELTSDDGRPISRTTQTQAVLRS